MSPVIPIVTSLFAVVALFLLAEGVSHARKANKAARWPRAAAVLESAAVNEERDEDGVTWRAVVSYTYRVDGRAYTGDRIWFGHHDSNRRQTQQAILDELRAAPRLQARYNPERPEESCLMHGVTPAHVLRIAFSVALLVFSVGFGLLAHAT